MDSSSTFSVTYKIVADSLPAAEEISESIAVEQSVEMPPATVAKHLKGGIGRVERIKRIDDTSWETEIHFSTSLVDGDPVQFLNVLLGNSSLKPGIRIVDLDKSYLSSILDGPSFGISGIRTLLNVFNRPLSCTALKPVGSSIKELADKAFQFASGGIDLIKDDHGIANQSSAPFKERVATVCKAIEKGEQKSGKKTLYFPNVTGSPREVTDRARFAKETGADGVLISPQLTGPAQMRDLAASDLNLPIMAHPAFSGSIVNHKQNGISAEIYYGLIWRAFGADSIVYPNAGGRFSFDLAECKSINLMCRDKNIGMAPSFPTPGGGIERSTVHKWKQEYGPDTIFLIGGSLYQHPKGLEIAVTEFQQKLVNNE